MLRKLRNAYYKNANSVDAIQRNNIALLTDMIFAQPIVEAVSLQASVNSMELNHGDRKNTFLVR